MRASDGQRRSARAFVAEPDHPASRGKETVHGAHDSCEAHSCESLSCESPSCESRSCRRRSPRHRLLRRRILAERHGGLATRDPRPGRRLHAPVHRRERKDPTRSTRPHRNGVAHRAERRPHARSLDLTRPPTRRALGRLGRRLRAHGDRDLLHRDRSDERAGDRSSFHGPRPFLSPARNVRPLNPRSQP
jgi:hypothetical protein